MLQVFNLVRKCHGADETTEEVGLLLAGMRSSCDMALGGTFSKRDFVGPGLLD